MACRVTIYTLSIIVLSVTGWVWCDCSRCAVCVESTGLCASCPPGSWGYECDRECYSDKCIDNTCEQFSGHCMCIPGYYALHVSRGQVCLPCPENCVECQSSSQCLKCVDGKFGDTCEKNCSAGCAKCVAAWSGSDYGRCLECSPGYYGVSSQCAFSCSYCQRGLCTESGCLLGCKESYYNYKSNCVRCFSSCKTCDESSWGNKTCLNCPDGKWGNLCDKECPSTCTSRTCNQTTGQCECSPGKYLHNNICRQCPENCMECTSSMQCRKCKDGKYGNACQHQCNENCLSCEKKSNRCTKCNRGNFLRDASCDPCQGGCSECTWDSESQKQSCTSCLDGYYLDKVVDALNFECFKCLTGCSNCDINGRFDRCQSCYEGYFPYGHICCPNNCTECSTIRCTSCLEGLHGYRCHLKCHGNCLTCSGPDSCNTCKPGRYSIGSHYENYCECSISQCAKYADDGNCSDCKGLGWYSRGSDCCQCRNCHDFKCDINGNCLNGCSSPEKYGSKCDLSCRRMDLDCENCTGQSEETFECLQCRSDYLYVSNGTCDYCPNRCKGFKCGKDGICNGCEDGWAGDQCSIECGARCNVSCDQFGCAECNDGYFGNYCLETCAPECANNTEGVPICHMNGSCIGCNEGYWGKLCNRSCSKGCLHSVCHRTTGRCEEGCKEGLRGYRCKQLAVSGPLNCGSQPPKEHHIFLLIAILDLFLADLYYQNNI